MSTIQKNSIALALGLIVLTMLAFFPTQQSEAAVNTTPVTETDDDELPIVSQSEYEQNLPGVTPLTISQFVDVKNWFHKPYILYNGRRLNNV